MTDKPDHKETERAVKELQKEITDSKRGDGVSLESEKRLQAFLDASPGSALLIDGKGTILAINKAGAKRLNRNENELIGMDAFDIIPALVSRNRKHHVSEAIRSNRIIRFEAQRDGMVFNNTICPIPDDSGKVKHLAIYSKDITEQRLAEEALKKSHHELEQKVNKRTIELEKKNTQLKNEVRLRKQREKQLDTIQLERTLILDSLSELVVYQDADMKILWANKAAGESVGISPDKLEGRHCYEGLHQRSKPCIECPVVKEIKTGEPQKSEIKSPDGRFWSIQGIPVQDKNGNLTGMIETTANITETKRMEEELRKAQNQLELKVQERTAELMTTTQQLQKEIEEHKEVKKQLHESEEKYGILVETLNEGFVILDEDLVVTYVNEKLCKILEYQREEIIGTSVIHFLGKLNRKTLNKRVAQLKKGEPVSLEITLQKISGGNIQSILSAKPMFDINGRYQGVFAVITDITRLKHTEYSLKQREKELKTKTVKLQEVNTALKVLLKAREHDIKETEKKILFNMKQLAMPYIQKLKKSKLDDRQIIYLDILETNLSEITSPLMKKLSPEHSNLSPKEIQVANLIIQGKSTKDIAELFSSSVRTIEAHRSNIRKKMGIKNKQVNLRIHLSPTFNT
ncbi:MAG: PAS domain-containing protein [Thermodesulfobacteriota bacterium]|nr:PAS domain-containing protein [Thermodesulfobacteriota bacterium]